MTKEIRDEVEYYAGHNKIPKKYWPEMVKIALKFYHGHLGKALEELVTLQGRTNKHIGSTLDSFLKETGDLEAVNELTQKKLLVLKIQRAMKRKRMSKRNFMIAMDSTGLVIERLLDTKEVGRISLEILLRAQSVLGINLIDLSV